MLRQGFYSLSVTWPFGMIEIDQTGIVVRIDVSSTLAKVLFPIYVIGKIAGLNRDVRIPLENIASVERKKFVPLIADGIKITTRDKNAEWIYFWSLKSSDRIVREIQGRMGNQRH